MTAPHAGQRRRRKKGAVTEVEVPRRHRRDWKEAGKIHEHQVAAVERELLTDNPRPVPAKNRRAWVPIKEQQRPETSHPLLKNPKGEITEFFGWLRDWTVHLIVWSPRYIKRCACSTGRGVQRVWDGTVDYVTMPDKLWAIQLAKQEGRQEDLRKMGAIYDKLRKTRTQRAIGFWLGVPWVLLFVLMLAGPWLTALALTGWLAWFGRRPDESVAATSQSTPTVAAAPEPRPSAELVYAALHHSSFPECTIAESPHREGPGWEAVAVLPKGPKSFRDVAAKLDALAGNLEVDAERCDLTPVKGEHGSARHVRIWWSKQDTLKGEPPAHPLLNPSALPADLWDRGVPVGVDRRGRIQYAPVVDSPFWLVVGGPNSGKTWTLFGIAAAAAADPLWDVDAWTFQASGSFAPLKDLCGVYDYGDDQAAFDRLHKYLCDLKKDVGGRHQFLDDLPIARNPNDKVERAEAERPGSIVRPRLVFMDEFLTPLAEDPRILPLLEDFGRKLRKLHIVFVLSGQYVDRDTVKKLSRLFGTRICMRTNQHDDTETVLGGYHIPGLTEAHKIPPSTPGVGFIGGTNPDPELGEMPATRTKMFGVSRLALESHVERCIDMRRSSLPPPPADGPVDLSKGDVRPGGRTDARRQLLQAFRDGDERVRVSTIVDRLDVEQADVRDLADRAEVLVRKERPDPSGTGDRWDGTRPSIRRDDLT